MPPAERPTQTTNFGTHSIMDFSRNHQGYNFVGGTGNDQQGLPMDELNNGNAMEQDILRRLAATRAAGLPMGQDNSPFGMGTSSMMGGPGAMFGQAMPTNLGAANHGVSSGGASSDPRLSMMHQQADREEELLFQLLLARRRRQNEIQHDVQQDSERAQVGFADEILRLRQAGNVAAASSAAMFAADQDQLQQLQQQQQQSMLPPMFQGGSGLNLGGSNPFAMMQDQGGHGGLRAPGIATNTFAGGRRFDDFLLRSQQHQPQDSILASFEQQRIEPSSSRYLSSFHQQAAGFMDLSNKRIFSEDTKMGGELDKMDRLGEPPSKKKRFHKKKPADMPRRPLSAYNLFFSEERERILKEIDGKDGTTPSKHGNDSETEDKTQDEGKDNVARDGTEESTSGEMKKPRALLRPLLPSQKKRRPHRKTHGKISFRLLAQMVGQRWKALPEERRIYYQELAKEDTVRQKKAMEEYYLKQSEKVKKEDEVDTDNENSKSQSISSATQLLM